MDVATLEVLSPVIFGGTLVMSIAWVLNTWIRVKNGYPLENSWGKAVYPQSTVAEERVSLLTQENAQLRAEVGALKDRLGNVERIVTDSGYQLTHEIDRLRDREGVN